MRGNRFPQWFTEAKDGLSGADQVEVGTASLQVGAECAHLKQDVCFRENLGPTLGEPGSLINIRVVRESSLDAGPGFNKDIKACLDQRGHDGGDGGYPTLTRKRFRGNSNNHRIDEK